MNTLLLPDQVIALVKEHYPKVNIESCTFFNRGFNDHYLIVTTQDKFIFRVYLNNKYYIESDDAYQFEMDFIEHLHANNISVARPIPTDSGRLLGSTKTPLGNRAFALFTYADGVRLNRDSIFPEQSYQLGKSMAQMHLAANAFDTKHARYKLDKKYLIDEPLRLIAERAKAADAKNDDLLKHAQYVVEKLQPLDKYIESIDNIGSDNNEFGIIHADLHLGNVHFQGNNFTIFDFDHCAYGWRAYDLAIGGGMRKECRESMIEGYESVRPLSDAERASIQDFGNLRNLWDIGDIMATEGLRETPS